MHCYRFIFRTPDTSDITGKPKYTPYTETAKPMSHVKSTERKIKYYEKAKELILEGGLRQEAERLAKNYIEPNKQQISKCKSSSRLKKCASPPHFSARNNPYSDIRKHDAIVHKQLKEKQVLDECTFSPNISNPKPEYIRHPDDFYRDQKLHEMNKIYRINIMEREIIEKENNTGRPFVTKQSQDLAKKRGLNQNIHERLYKEHSTKKLKEGLNAIMSLRKDKNERKKSTSRKTPIEFDLYQDAINRQKSRDAPNHIKNDSFSKNPAIIDTTSEKYAIKRTVKDLRYMWDYIQKEIKSAETSEYSTQPESKPDRLNLISTAYMLTMLGYLSKNGAQSEEEKNLFYDLWTLIKGEDYNGVTFDTLKTIILTIHGFHRGENKSTMDNAEYDSDIVYKRIGEIMNEDCSD